MSKDNFISYIDNGSLFDCLGELKENHNFSDDLLISA